MDHGQGHTIYVHVEGVPRDIPKVSSHSCEQFVYITTLAAISRKIGPPASPRPHAHFTCVSYVSMPRIAYPALGSRREGKDFIAFMNLMTNCSR